MQKWETHAHTKDASICGEVGAEEIVTTYLQAGYDGIVVTNHFNLSNFRKCFGPDETVWIQKYLDAYEAVRKSGEEHGLKVLLGLELCLVGDEKRRFTQKYAELLLYGITPEELAHYGTDIIYRKQKSLFELCEANGWILGQSHPYRTHVKPLDFTLMHCLETYNGHPGHINRNERAEKTALKYNLAPIGGSDFHEKHHIGSGMEFPDDISIVTEKDLAAAILSRRGVIVKK